MGKKRFKKGKIVVNKTISCDESTDAGSKIHDLVSVDGTSAAGGKKSSGEKSEDLVRIITDIQSEEDLGPGVKTSLDYSSEDQITSVVSDIEEEIPHEPLADDIKCARSCALEIGVVALTVIAILAGILILCVVYIYQEYGPKDSTFGHVVKGGPVAEAASSTTSSTTTTTSSTSITSTTTSTSSPPPAPVCRPPYMRLGLGCCLDSQGNGLCDTDEHSTTSSTVLDYVICRRDADCGATRTEYICRIGDVYRLTFTHVCRRPGLTSSACEQVVIDDLVDSCGPAYQCVTGRNRCQPRYTSNNFMD
ncbi:MAG: hypothetical protein V1875_06285 [Candidatus Altiarchaeota archaeon]